MRFIKITLAAAVLAGITASITQAHHSMSTYDLDTNVMIEGNVTRVQWVNPHVFIYIDQTTDSGEIINWAIEGLNPSAMRRLGWGRGTVALGEPLIVNGHPGKTPGSYSIYPRSMSQGDNHIFDEGAHFASVLGEQKTTEAQATSLAGVWKTPLTPNVITTDFGGDLHDMTAKAKTAQAQFVEETMNPAISCAQMSAPLIMHFGDVKRITLADDNILIQGDYDGGERTIHMNLENHDGATFSNQGHSIGKWENDTLVINTTHFSDSIYGNGIGIPSGSQKQLIERLSLSEDGSALAYRFEVTDPEYLASPMTYETQWVYRPDLEFVIEGCDLDSATRFQRN